MADDALRLTFEWREGAIALRDARPAPKRAPAGEEAGKPLAEDAVGVWVEVRREGRVVYRRHVGPLFEASHEIQTGDPARPFARVDRRRPFAVEVVVPAPPQGGPGARVALFERRSEGRPAARGERAKVRQTDHVDVEIERFLADRDRGGRTDPSGREAR